MKKAKLLLKSKIETELKEISKNLNEQNKEEYKILQNKLNEIIENEVQGSILRSLCQEYEAGEKCTKYFFSLEKFKAKQKTISRLERNDGSFTSNQKEILSDCRNFYKTLYSKNAAVNPDNFPEFYSNDDLPKLSEQQKESCEDTLTEQELLATLKTFRKNKSPGIDGLTAEFYLTFWGDIKNKLIEMYNEAFLAKLLPDCLCTGVIVLLEKKGKDRLKIANWRPITLLNIDYKLLTKTLSTRLKKVLPFLINKDQNGFVPGGNIFF